MPVLKEKRLICATLNVAYEHERAALRGIRTYTLEHPNLRVALIGYNGRLLNERWAQSANGFIGTFRKAQGEGADLALAERLAPGRVVGLSSADREIGIPRVLTCNRQVGRLAAEFFHNRGYQNFAYVGDLNPLGHHASIERAESFQEALAGYGHPCRLLQFNEIYTEAFQLPIPCAVLGFSDRVARLVIERLLQLELAVPEHVAVLGVDDDSLESDVCPIPLSSIRLDGEQIGYKAAQLLDSLLNGEKHPDPLMLRIPPIGVQERASTGSRISDDKLLLDTLHVIRKEISTLRTVGDVLELVNSSRRALERRFRNALGRGIYDVMQEARVDFAKRLLVETDLKLIDLAEVAGFGDSRMLSVSFRRHTGETPSGYRRRHRKLKPSRRV